MVRTRSMSKSQQAGLSALDPDASQHEAPAATAPTADAPICDFGNVSRALRIIRESPVGGSVSAATVEAILETELSRVWAMLSESPDTFTPSRNEWEVLSHFQHRFIGNKKWADVRKRYWDQLLDVESFRNPPRPYDSDELREWGVTGNPKQTTMSVSDIFTDDSGYGGRNVGSQSFAQLNLKNPTAEDRSGRNRNARGEHDALLTKPTTQTQIESPVTSLSKRRVDERLLGRMAEGHTPSLSSEAVVHHSRTLLDVSVDPVLKSTEKLKREVTKSISRSQTIDTQTSQSCSESTVTALSDTTESDIAATMIATRGAQKVSNKLLAFFCRFIEFKLSVAGSQRPGGDSSPKRNRRTQQKVTGAGGSQSKASKGKGKRVFKPDDGFDEMGQAPDDEEPEAKRNKADKLKIACPYMKRFPTEFGTWRTCVGPGFDGMHRMKEHLKRKHYKENGCHRCGLYLDSNQALQEHLRLPEICLVKEILPQVGFMTQIQWEMISKKRRVQSTPLLERWKEVYLVLFPNADENSIPSPYFEASETSDGLSSMFDPQEYECFLKQHLPARILMNLNREFQIISDLAKGKLAEMLQQESLEILKAYVLQKGGNSSQTLQTGSPGTEPLGSGLIDNDLFENIEALGDEGQDTFDFSFLETYCQHAEKEGSEQADSGYGPSVM